MGGLPREQNRAHSYFHKSHEKEELHKEMAHRLESWLDRSQSLPKFVHQERT